LVLVGVKPSYYQEIADYRYARECYEEALGLVKQIPGIKAMELDGPCPLIYNEEMIRSIISCDETFYAKFGDTGNVEEIIINAFKHSAQGGLLGYGSQRTTKGIFYILRIMDSTGDMVVHCFIKRNEADTLGQKYANGIKMLRGGSPYYEIRRIFSLSDNKKRLGDTAHNPKRSSPLENITFERAKAYAQQLSRIYDFIEEGVLEFSKIEEVLNIFHKDPEKKIETSFDRNVIQWIQETQTEFRDMMPHEFEVTISKRRDPLDLIFTSEGAAIIVEGNMPNSGKGSMAYALLSVDKKDALAIGGEDCSITFSAGSHNFAATYFEDSIAFQRRGNYRARAFTWLDQASVKWMSRVGVIRGFICLIHDHYEYDNPIYKVEEVPFRQGGSVKGVYLSHSLTCEQAEEYLTYAKKAYQDIILPILSSPAKDFGGSLNNGATKNREVTFLRQIVAEIRSAMIRTPLKRSVRENDLRLGHNRLDGVCYAVSIAANNRIHYLAVDKDVGVSVRQHQVKKIFPLYILHRRGSIPFMTRPLGL